jgi:hypothetical protein
MRWANNSKTFDSMHFAHLGESRASRLPHRTLVSKPGNPPNLHRHPPPNPPVAPHNPLPKPHRFSRQVSARATSGRYRHQNPPQNLPQNLQNLPRNGPTPRSATAGTARTVWRCVAPASFGFHRHRQRLRVSCSPSPPMHPTPAL